MNITSIWVVWIVQINYEQAMRLIKKTYVHGGQYSSGFSMWQLSMLIVLLNSLASKQITHLEFRKELYKELFKQGQAESVPILRKRSRDLQDLDEPAYEGEHQVKRIQPRKWCYWCKAQADRAKVQKRAILTVFQTSFSCKACNIPLCKQDTRSCWAEFHRPRVPLGEKDANRL